VKGGAFGAIVISALQDMLGDTSVVLQASKLYDDVAAAGWLEESSDAPTKVRKTPSWPRSWANFSLF
jgi:hypothetical protein